MAEAGAKRALALEAAGEAGYGALVATGRATVRWLLCGRGRPVDDAAPESPYAVVLGARTAAVLYADIEHSRVAAEERFEELGYEPVPYPWHEGPETAVRRLLGSEPALDHGVLDELLAPARRTLVAEERGRYRAAGAAAASALVDTLGALGPSATEREAAAELARQARLRALVPLVVLVAGERRQQLHRHPLPATEALGRHALLALTAEREGLHVSLTRLVSFGEPPERLAALVADAAAVDAAMLRASRPGTTLGAVLDTAAEAYAAAGHPEEWRRHHQGGIAGYRGREVFAVPGEPTPLPASCAVAWNPSIAGGAKSEDTALVGDGEAEVVTRTPALPELDLDGRPRPAIAVLGGSP